IGTKESIEKISLKDIEEFINQRVVIKKAIVVVGGDLNIDEAKKATKELLGVLEVGNDKELKLVNLGKDRKDVRVKKETEQAYIYFGSPLYLEKSDDEYIAKTAAFILGSGGFGSRMMEEIRVKRGLAYSAYSRFNLNKTSTFFSGYLQTKLESEKEAKEVVQELVDEFVKKGVTQQELDDAKKFLQGSEPLRVETMSQRLGRSFNEFYKGKELGWSKSQLEKIKNLDLKTLNDFIKEHKEIKDLTFSIVTK
ncbi:MAG: insulinase family protein, partial [Campylobacterales bacterium]|nr:insulinase family protein [Campylobacterales bacterium]